MKRCEDVGPWAGRPRAQMMKSDEVEAILHLRELGWGLRRIAREFGCSKNTVNSVQSILCSPARSRSLPSAACRPPRRRPKNALQSVNLADYIRRLYAGLETGRLQIAHCGSGLRPSRRVGRVLRVTAAGSLSLRRSGNRRGSCVPDSPDSPFCYASAFDFNSASCSLINALISSVMESNVVHCSL